MNTSQAQSIDNIHNLNNALSPSNKIPSPSTSTPKTVARGSLENQQLLDASAAQNPDLQAGHEEDELETQPFLHDETCSTTMIFVFSQQTDGSSVLLPAPSEQLYDPLLKRAAPNPSFAEFLRAAENARIDGDPQKDMQDDEDYVISSSESSDEDN